MSSSFHYRDKAEVIQGKVQFNRVNEQGSRTKILLIQLLCMVSIVCCSYSRYSSMLRSFTYNHLIYNMQAGAHYASLYD